MLNGDGNENCKKNNSLISNKKQLCTCSTLFCSILCRCFARPQRKTFQLHILWKTSVLCAHQRFCCLCSCSLFFCAAAHFYLASFSLPATSISHFLTAGRYKIFTLSFQQNSSPLFFYLSLSLFLCYPRQSRH